MPQSPDPVRPTLVFLPDGDQLRDLHPGWPAGAGAAYCLRGCGAATVVLFHAGDPHALSWVAGKLGVSLDDVLVVPRVDGLGSLPFGFADEQALLAALEGVADLAGAAARWLAAEAAAERAARARAADARAPFLRRPSPFAGVLRAP